MNTFIALQEVCKFEPAYAEKKFDEYAVGSRSYLFKAFPNPEEQSEAYLPYYLVHSERIPDDLQVANQHHVKLIKSIINKSKITTKNSLSVRQQLLCHFNSSDQLWGNGYIRESQIETTLKEIYKGS